MAMTCNTGRHTALITAAIIVESTGYMHVTGGSYSGDTLTSVEHPTDGDVGSFTEITDALEYTGSFRTGAENNGYFLAHRHRCEC